MENNTTKKVLIAFLDWGLGHTTRSSVIIKKLIKQGFSVTVAANAVQEKILKTEFVNLTILHLDGYNIEYGKNSGGTFWKLLLQIPKIFIAIKAENRWLQQQIAIQKFDIIISDNRYGFYAKGCYNIFITHQLRIKAFFSFFETILQSINYSFIEKFDECWIPDTEGNSAVAAQLAHPKQLPIIPTKYIGLLSRMEYKDVEMKYDFCFLISGPEPQRSIFEQKILDLVKQLKHKKCVVIRGLPNSQGNINIDTINHITVYNHLQQAKMEQVLNQSEWVICRSGYTSIMELLMLKKKMLLVPTPFQTEQLYLAKHLSQQGLANYLLQSQLSVENIKQFTMKEGNKSNNYTFENNALLNAIEQLKR